MFDCDNIYQYLYAYEEGNPTDKPDWDTKSRIAVGGFNDQSRDGMRGANNGGNNLPGDGFISEGWDAGKVTDMIKGMHPGKGGNPTQTVNYLSCHDNFTIFDQLNYNIGNGKVEPELSLIGDAVVSAYSAVLLSQGIAFLHGGDEFLRTKIEEVGPDGEYQGDEKGMVEMYGKVISHNSYKSAPKTNAFHYDRKIEVKETYDKFVEAIHLRNSLKLCLDEM